MVGIRIKSANRKCQEYIKDNEQTNIVFLRINFALTLEYAVTSISPLFKCRPYFR